MKAVKKTFKWTLITGVSSVMLLGAFNSLSIKTTSLKLKNDLNIKFAKRLDEITGEYVVGRNAASLPKFEKPVAKKVKKIIKVSKAPIKETPKTRESIEEANPPKVQNVSGAVLVGGFYDKTPLKNVPVDAGELHVLNGEMNNISVRFPDGRIFNPIFLPNKMVGNVFQYEDSGTNEIKSGLIYPLGEGHYMVTFTDDSVFSTVRLEFKTRDRLASNVKDNANCGIDEQNYANDNMKAQAEDPYSYEVESPKEAPSFDQGDYAQYEDPQEFYPEESGFEPQIDENYNQNDEFVRGEEQDADWFRDDEYNEQPRYEENYNTTQATNKSDFSFKFASK